jgi:hypothetical protein
MFISYIYITLFFLTCFSLSLILEITPYGNLNRIFSHKHHNNISYFVFVSIPSHLILNIHNAPNHYIYHIIKIYPKDCINDHNNNMFSIFGLEFWISKFEYHITNVYRKFYQCIRVPLRRIFLLVILLFFYNYLSTWTNEFFLSKINHNLCTLLFLD